MPVDPFFKKILHITLLFLWTVFCWSLGTAWALNVNELVLKELKGNGTWLDLRYSGTFGEEGTKQLAKSRLLRNLRFLGLREHNIGDGGVKALAASKYLKNLEGLNLFYGKVGPEGAKAIASSENFSRLKYLGLWGNPLGKEAA